MHSGSRQRLFVGITSWNSRLFLGACLDSIRRNTERSETRIVVLDNQSTDESPGIALERGAEVLSRHCGQAHALEELFNLSRSEYTLLIHSDVVLLSSSWLDTCVSRLIGNCALVSPEDIGCGPNTRPWGKGMPESSFLLFKTRSARSLRQLRWKQRFKMRLPYRALDFQGDHITYNLPELFSRANLTWAMMKVHTSPKAPEPIYVPAFHPETWYPHLADYEYGLGNFYSLDGEVTHYHNWYERNLVDVSEDSTATLPPHAGGLPLAFLKRYSMRFLEALSNGSLKIPDLQSGKS